jgi:hypothetical protein
VAVCILVYLLRLYSLCDAQEFCLALHLAARRSMGTLLPGALREALRLARQTAGEQSNGVPPAPFVTMWPASGVKPGATDTSNGAPPPNLTHPPVPPPPQQQPARNLNKATALREARREARQRAGEPVVVQGEPVVVHGKSVVE